MAGSSARLTPPPSPTASFYDISDDDEGDYNTITHTSTGKGVKLLFSKSKVCTHPVSLIHCFQQAIVSRVFPTMDKDFDLPPSFLRQVYVHPTPSSKDNIPGFIALIQQKSTPSTEGDLSQPSSAVTKPNASSYLLAWVPESSLGNAYSTYVKVDMSDSTSPPRQSYLVPPLPTTSSDPGSIGLYAFAVPLSQIYSLLVRPPSLGWWFGSVVINTRAGDSFPALFFHDTECESTILQKKKRTRESFDPFDEGGNMFWGGDEVLRWLKRYVTVERSGADPSAYLINPSEEDKMSFGHPLTVDKSQPSQPRQKDAGMDPLTRVLKETRWKVLEQLSKITTFTRRTAQDIADNPKVPPQVRRLMRNPEIQTLQEEFDSARNDDERKAILNSKRDEYVRLKGAWWERLVEGLSSAGDLEWWKEQKARIEKDVHRTDRTIPLFAGEDIPHPDPDSPFAETGTNVHMEQMKDMLLTYNEYNRDLGYVQGMSDLLAPIYAVMQDDAVAFWGFVGYMDRMERNFLRDQSGMRSQLLTLDQLVQLMDPQLYLHLQSADSTNFFFFFRMFLVWYKREFEWVDVLRLWEALWTDYLSSNFHLFIALAILEKHRDVIMDHLKHFDEVLKYINDLSNTMELIPILSRAEALFRRFEKKVEAIDKKNNFPTPPVRRRIVGSSDSGTRSYPSTQQTSDSRASQLVSRDRSRSTPTSPNNRRADLERIITPELRGLMSKTVQVLDATQVREHGGGTRRN
ncbi:GTPase-activating protein GYP7 [Histoplasma capsulatum H143]|uniref:GTPase-activating protein GYP7 n=1 Tax=Ajellomyces capsulatus (strain H143) TaxID=544712 RepID=C6H6A7_AJECH|nr:GTPase-activating protein GYP7 [Histoplasma capsulatum H143]